MRVWAWGCPICSSVCFVNSYVSSPLPALLCFLEAAQRCIISSGQCCVQELPLHQDHHHYHQLRLHRRREPPPAQRTGPLTGNCTRRGTLMFIDTIYSLTDVVISHMTWWFFSLSKDCFEGERSAGVAEEIWGQPTGSGGDEVRGSTLSCHVLHHSEVTLAHKHTHTHGFNTFTCFF